MQRTFSENCYLLWLCISLMHQSTDASLLSERSQRKRWGLTVAQRENWSPSASSHHPDLWMGWTQSKEQLRYAHPPTGSSTLAFPWLPGKSWLPSCLPELLPFGGQCTLHLLKTGFPDTLESQMITDRQRREIKQGKEFKVGWEKDKLEIGFNYTDVMVIRVRWVGRCICKSRKFCSSGNNFFPLCLASAQSWSRQHRARSARRQPTSAGPCGWWRVGLYQHWCNLFRCSGQAHPPAALK